MTNTTNNDINTDNICPACNLNQSEYYTYLSAQLLGADCCFGAAATPIVPTPHYTSAVELGTISYTGWRRNIMRHRDGLPPSMKVGIRDYETTVKQRLVCLFLSNYIYNPQVGLERGPFKSYGVWMQPRSCIEVSNGAGREREKRGFA